MSSLIRANCFHIYLSCLCLLLLNKHKEPISHSQSCGNLMKIIHFWFLRIKRSTLFCKALLINSTNLFMTAYFKWGAYTGSRSPPCPRLPRPPSGIVKEESYIVKVRTRSQHTARARPAPGTSLGSETLIRGAPGCAFLLNHLTGWECELGQKSKNQHFC